MTTTRIALVTGANKGIGLEIVRQLARQGVVTVLGARDRAKGEVAARTLAAEGLEPVVVALDVTDGNSIVDAAAEVVRLYGRIDILVNNAAILIDGPGGFQASLFDLTSETARRTYDTNVLGPLRMTQAVVPIMRNGGFGRIVNVSSGAGQLSDMRSGFPAYRMSKTALNALTRITAAELAGTPIKVNAVCPGWVKTDMGGPNAERPVERGAETPVWLAMLPDDGPTGGFFRDMKSIPW
ncbi:MAG: SDR family oxidoreductase [Hyphomicrobium sp.]|nr:SDR family oxidoreductase [Hyphomicrobium sp.]